MSATSVSQAQNTSGCALSTLSTFRAASLVVTRVIGCFRIGVSDLGEGDEEEEGSGGEGEGETGDWGVEDA
jgi:hypothetical protein